MEPRSFYNASTGLQQEGDGNANFDSLIVYGNAAGLDLQTTVTVTNSDIFDNLGSGITSSYNPLTCRTPRSTGTRMAL